MRKRINLSIREDEHAKLIRISKDYGFRNVHDMIITLLRAYVKRVESAESDEPIDDEISETFAGFMGGNQTKQDGQNLQAIHDPRRNRYK